MSTGMILAFYNTVLLPDVDYRLSVEGISDREKERIRADGGRAVLMPLKEERERTEIAPGDFYELGVACEVLEINEGPMGTFVHARTREKVRADAIRNENGIMEGEFETVGEVMDVTFEGEKMLLDTLKETTTNLASMIRGGDYAIEYIKKITTVNEFASVFCQSRCSRRTPSGREAAGWRKP